MGSNILGNYNVVCVYDRASVMLKPKDYIALHLLNCIICAITIGVLYEIYFG
jgi:hypothetical protein